MYLSNTTTLLDSTHKHDQAPPSASEYSQPRVALRLSASRHFYSIQARILGLEFQYDRSTVLLFPLRSSRLIDTHDTGDTDPGDFGVLISDVDDEKFRVIVVSDTVPCGGEGRYQQGDQNWGLLYIRANYSQVH